MVSILGCRRYVYPALAVLILAACAGQVEPAQRSISDIETIVSAAAPEAAKYVPDQLADVQNKLGELKAAFERKDYSAVLTGAPATMSAAQALADASAAKKDELTKALNDQWSGFAAVLPDHMTAIQNRIDLLGKKTVGKKPVATVDLDEARTSLSGAVTLWSKAQAAFATGNLSEAVSTATTLDSNLNALAGTLSLNL